MKEMLTGEAIKTKPRRDRIIAKSEVQIAIMCAP
jgi:hypothetical protein